MLHAIPTTPLYDRLKQEGRLSDDEASDEFGTNVIPLGMSREELREGFIQVMQSCYRADAYFQRLDAQFIDEEFKFTIHQPPYWASHRWAWAKRCLLNYCKFLVVTTRLLRLVTDEALRVGIQATAVTHAAHPLARAPHPVRLRAQGRDPLSLRRDYPCFGASRGWQRRPARCGAIILACEATGRGASRGLTDSGASAKRSTTGTPGAS